MNQLLKEIIKAVVTVLLLPFRIIKKVVVRLKAINSRKLIILVSAAIIVTAVFLLAVVEVSSLPTFCGSCHIMRPYVEAWKNSSHADVPCITCHAQEGISGIIETKFTAISMVANYMNGLYKRSKPWAEIEDKNCLQGGCHETRLLEGKIEFKSGVVFDHTPHLNETRRGRKLRCTSCHSQIVQGEHISVTTSTCFLCHFKNTDSLDRRHLSDCLLCHTPPTGSEADSLGVHDHQSILDEGIACSVCHVSMWQGEGAVLEERCGACHSQQGHLERINDLEFIHEWHIEKRKVECQRCHSPIDHINQGISHEIDGDCRKCHEQRHDPMLAMYSGTGSRLVEKAAPSVMHEEGVVCRSCHKDEVTGKGAAIVTANMCEPCHDASYRNLASSWRSTLEAQISVLERRLQEGIVHPRSQDALHDLALLKNGGVWHNPKYAESILQAISQVIAEAEGEEIPSIKIPPESEACFTCHIGISMATIELPFSSFDHNEHFGERQIKCSDCHTQLDPQKSRHGRLQYNMQICNDCHHGELAAAEDLCQPCHAPSRAVFSGDLNIDSATPSPMFEAEMVCMDCHLPENALVPNTDNCLDCHDEEVVTDLEFLQGRISLDLEQYEHTRDPNIQLIKLDPGKAAHHPSLILDILE
ncbi:MAG TPA: hypothetical protein ENH10_04470 [Bacteroidetes bacterium]|nr:hypothetical protein BMS3Bbin04_01311 [bacterium BMS3Bbin04]HDO65269.1 hypothetical protein [Bacteroidota bacterium]HEX04394.1 hypothetical protein [Bacteroidota bacterium]